MSTDIYETFGKNLYRITETTIPNVVEIDPVNIGPGVLTSILDQSVGVLKVGKNDFDNVKAGYILGLDDGTAKFYIGNSSQYLNWTGSALNMSGTITATAGTIGGWTIDPTTISSATSGERIVLDQGNKKISLINSSGTSVVILSYGTLTGDSALTVEQKDDNRTGIKITTNSGITGNHSLYITNLANDSNSQGIFIGRSGSSASTIYGLAVSSSNSGAGSATAGDFGAPTGIRITGATVWGMNLTTTGGGITIAQSGSSDSYTLFADNDSSSLNSYCAWFDRDLNTSGTAYSAIFTCDNAGGNATALDVKATAAGGSTGIDIRCTGAHIGIQLTSQTKVFKFASDATAAGSYAGRVPIDVDGNLRYIHYYNA